MALRLLRSVSFGVETVAPRDQARHYHREAYATVVLAGRFTEASFAGCSSVGPGDVLLHGAFDAHANVSSSSAGPTILRLPWFGAGPEGHFRIADPDRLVRVAERCPGGARDLLLGELISSTHGQPQWTDRLAAELLRGSVASLQHWADRNGLSPEAVSRGFGRVFQVSPKLFRLETRTRAAWLAIMRSQERLTTIAHRFGFADLAHMSRSIRRLTGAGPRWWRVSPGIDQVHSSPAADIGAIKQHLKAG